MDKVQSQPLFKDKELYYLLTNDNKANELLNVEQYCLQHAADSEPTLASKAQDYHLSKEGKLNPLGPKYSTEDNQNYTTFLDDLSKGNLPSPGTLPNNETAPELSLNSTTIDQNRGSLSHQSPFDLRVPVTKTVEQNEKSTVPSITKESPAPNYDIRENRGEQNIIHEVSPTDTLEGIVIRYGVSKDAIRMANEFSGDEVYMRKTLVIPKTKGPLYHYIDPREYNEVQKLYAIDMLIIWIKAKYNDQKSYSVEAKYYLELHNYNLNAAFKDFEDDIEFERQASLNKKGPVVGKKSDSKKVSYESQTLINKKKK